MPVTPTFDYTLGEELRGEPGSAGITVILIEPQIAQRSGWLPAKVEWSTLPGNMAGDLEEMLIARGFVFVGPFRTRDEVVYPERLGSDFFLEAEIDMGFELGRISMGQWRECDSAVCIGDSDPDYVTHQYIDSGTVALTGRVDFELVETITENALWRRSYAIPGEAHTFAGNPSLDYGSVSRAQELAIRGPAGIAELLRGEPGLVNTVGDALEKLYGDVLTAAARQLDPQGLQREKQLADSLKAR